MQTSSPTLLRIVLTVFLPFASGYYMSYFFRTVNAVIQPDLRAEFDLGAGELGLMTAAYFFTFAAFQLPLGILLDRFGPVRVQSALLTTAALGAGVFAMGDTVTTLFVGRALIGLGVSGGLMASFKAIVLWFPRERLPLVNGLFMSFGGLGALSATGPVELALGITDWRGVYAVVGIVTALVAAVILMISPDKPEARSSESVAHQIKGLFEVYRDKLFWRVAPVAIAGAGAGLAIQTLWVGPWLSDVAGLDRDTVAGHLTLVAAAMAAGMASMGIVADLAWQKFSIPPRRVFLAGSIIFLLVQLLLIAEFMQISLYLWMLFGFLSNFSAMAFAILSQHFPTKRSGVANTGMNLFVFAMAFALQYGIGAVIDSFPVTAAGTYSPEAFQTAFGVVAAIQVAAITWFLIAPRIIGRPEPLVD